MVSNFFLKQSINLTIITFILFISSCGSSARDYEAELEQNENENVIIKPYFSATSGDYRNGYGIDSIIIEDIDGAKDSIVLAIYNLTNDKIKNALINAHQRGIKTEIIVEDGYFFSDDIKDIKNAGISLISDENTKSLMHNKFIVIDDYITWSGSTNYTYHAFYRNNENAIRMQSKDIAYTYKKQFYELYNHDIKKGSFAKDGLEIYFSPEDNFKEKLLSLINRAENSIYFLTFAFTDQDISQALIQANKRGVTISGVFDESQNKSQSSSKYSTLKKANIDVKLDGNKYFLHNKVFIFDENIVVTGSYNFTVSANTKNAENSLVIENEDLSSRYINEFNTIYQLAKR